MADKWVVSPFALVSWRAGQIEITSASSGATLTTDNLDLVRLVHAFAQPRTVAEVMGALDEPVPARLAARIDDLIRAGMLTPAAAPEPATAYHWDWSALAYHRRSRRRGFRKSPSQDQDTSDVLRQPAVASISLVRPSGHAAGRDFAAVLDARRSCRTWPAVPIGYEIFSTLLWLSARAREPSAESFDDESVSRPYPSGGAAYSLEIYPVLAPDAVETIAAGVYRYVPACHGLEPVSHNASDFMPFLEAAAQSAETVRPQIVLLITSRFARQSATYGTLAYSLVLKEVGCLFQTLYLVAEYLGLAACALGGGSPPGRLARLCHTNELAEPIVGEFMLGPR